MNLAKSALRRQAKERIISRSQMTPEQLAREDAEEAVILRVLKIWMADRALDVMAKLMVKDGRAWSYDNAIEMIVEGRHRE